MILKKKSLLFIVLMLFIASAVKASDFKQGGLYYTIMSETNALCRLDAAPANDPYTGDIIVPETVTNEGKTYTVADIEDYTFYYLYSIHGNPISSLVVNAKVNKLPSHFCTCCESLTKVVLPSSLEEIGDMAFMSCNKLIDINLPNGIKKIGKDCFDGCESLVSITLPEELGFLEFRLFFDCRSLSKIVIPENVKDANSLGGQFENCTFLTDVILNNKNLNINRANTFQGCTALKNVIMPENQKKIESNCYKGCTAIENIDFIDDIESIASNAFDGCLNLKSISFGQNFKTFGDNAFNNCFDIISVNCRNKSPQPFNNSVFANTVFDKATLIVPWGCVDLYKNCEGWKNFKNIIEDPDVIDPRAISFANGNQIELVEGTTMKVDAEITPENASYFRVEWDAPQELGLNDISVNGNMPSCSITPTKAGTYVLTVKCLSEKTGELMCQNVCVVTVKENIRPAELVVEFTNPVIFNGVIPVWVKVSPSNFVGNYALSCSTRLPRLSEKNDIHGESEFVFYGNRVGKYNIVFALSNTDTNEIVLEKSIEVEVITSAVSFNTVEGIINTTTGENGMTITINANKGYKLHSVTCQNEDYTERFSEGKTVTLNPPLINPVFDIVYEKIDESVEVIENDSLKIVQRGKIIEIIGTQDENSPVVLYDDMGRVVQQTNSHLIMVEKGGIYILTVEGRSFKFMIAN